MTPLELAALEYEGSDRNFSEDLANYMAQAFLYSGPEAFIIARPMEKDRIREWDTFSKPHKNPDTWFVFLASGKKKLSRFLELAPFELPYIAFHRRTNNKMKFYNWSQFKEKVSRHG